MLRRSLYTISTQLDEGWLLINTLTGAVDEVSGEVVDALNSGDMGEDFGRYLTYRGHATSLSRDDEKSRGLAAWRALDSISRNHAAVVICPSMNCNFRCTYCFQRPLQERIDAGHVRSTDMTVEQVDLVFASFPALLHLHSVIKPHITLFGGEPLWAKNLATVEHIVKRAIPQGFTLSAITNGYQLSEFRHVLGEGGISSLQVSIDGPAEHHDKLRPTASQEATFARIVDQVRRVIDVPGLDLHIRMNYDSRNMKLAPHLLEELKHLGIMGRKNVSFHANLISMNHAGGKKDYRTLKSLSEVGKQIPAYELDCYTTSLRGDLHTALSTGEPFRRRAHYCLATAGMYMYAPDGAVYACWEGLGETHSYLGRYDPALEFDEAGLARWHRRNPLSMPKCQTCSHLFVCGGGCAVHALERTGSLNASECDGIKAKFDVMVRGYIRQQQGGVEGSPGPLQGCSL